MHDEDFIYDHIRRRIKKLRESHPKTEKKTTQDQLAKACGIDRSTLTNIELGNQRPPIVVVYRVCGFFGIDLDDVLPDLESVFAEDSASVEVGDTVHRVSGDKTATVIASLRLKRA